jgi:hypothetical protein
VIHHFLTCKGRREVTRGQATASQEPGMARAYGAVRYLLRGHIFHTFNNKCYVGWAPRPSDTNGHARPIFSTRYISCLPFRRRRSTQPCCENSCRKHGSHRSSREPIFALKSPARSRYPDRTIGTAGIIRPGSEMADFLGSKISGHW